MRHLNQPHTQHQAGFTIVELMIATVVSSVILLVITYGVVHFSSSYYKGINSSTTQTAAQNAIDTISQAIEFNSSGTVPTDGSQGIFCAGSQVFLYTLGVQLTGPPSSSNWGLYELNNLSASCPPSAPAITTGGVELLGSNMRLSSINVAQEGATNIWQLGIRIAYGAPDLLCNTTIAGNNKGGCNIHAVNYGTGDPITGDNITCKLQTGSQFCSVAELSTAIGQRITN